MVTIPKPSDIKNRELMITSTPVIQGRDDGAGLVAKSISELAGTTHEVFKDAVEKLNYAKDNAYIAEKKAEVDKFAIELLAEDKINYNEGLDGYAEGTNAKIKAKQAEILASTPNEITRNQLKRYFSTQQVQWYNEAYTDEVSQSSSYLAVQKNNTLKDLEGQVFRQAQTGVGIVGSHSLRMQGNDLITKGDGVNATPESIEKDLQQWNVNFTKALLLGMANSTENKTEIEIIPLLEEHLDINKKEFIELLGVVEYEALRADVMSLFPEQIQEEFTQNTKIFEMENEYEGNVFTSVVSQLDTFYDKDENGVNILSDNGSLIISQAGRNKLNQMTNGLDSTHQAAIIKYVEESVIGENTEITNDSYAIAYIDNQVANKLDPRQELNHYFLNNMITKTTYETYKDNYNKRSTGDRQDQDLLDAVEIHGSNITDLKKLLAWNDTKTTTVIQSWKKQIKDNAAFYKGDLQKLQIDWEKFLLKHSVDTATQYITNAEGPSHLTTSLTNAVYDHEGVAINETIIKTIDQAEGLSEPERQDFLKQEAELINDLINKNRIVNMKDGKIVPFPFTNQNELQLKRMKEEEELERKIEFERVRGSTERKQDLENIILEDILDITEDYTNRFINDPSVFTDPLKDPLTEKEIGVTIDRIYKRYEAIAEKQNISVPLSKSRIRKYIIEASLNIPSRGTVGHMAHQLDYTKAKPLDEFDLTFKHIKDNTIRKTLLEAVKRREDK